ncbi:MAG: M48 family metallopeptidase [Gammaproteobacteria bacterium]|nr:M48 family metallopeptidase [Gammaproteobacteria bacterium]
MASVLIAAPTAAQDAESEEDLKGIYEPVELRRREPNDLIDTAAQYKDMFERRSLLHADPEVLALVRKIGYELAPPPTDDYINYEFYVIRDPSPNAFAFPNGQIYIHTGMLARMSDESQLAALLAHEINHVAGHHTILSHRITAKRLAIQILGGGLASIMGQLRYSRHLEQEADDRAALLMEGTSYDPNAMTELLEILAEDFEGLDPRVASIWTTHPDPEERIEASRANLTAYPRKPREPVTFDAVVYSLKALTVRDYIHDDYPYTAIAVAEEFLERYPEDLDFRMALGDAQRQLGPRPAALPEDYSRRDARRNLRDRIRRTREQRMERLLEEPEGVAALAANLESARQTYLGILEIDPDYVAAHRGLGQVYERQGNDREAARAYLTYVQEAPDAPDRPVIMSRLAELRDRLLAEETNQ